MLVPAISYKAEIEEASKRLYYSKDLFLYGGSCQRQIIVQDEPGPSTFDWASIDRDGKLIGYLTYVHDLLISSVHNIGMISFDKGNPVFALDLYRELYKLIHEYKIHRMDWICNADNPAVKHYDRFMKMYNGTKWVLHDIYYDRHGNYHDMLSYEILFGERRSK